MSAISDIGSSDGRGCSLYVMPSRVIIVDHEHPTRMASVAASSYSHPVMTSTLRLVPHCHPSWQYEVFLFPVLDGGGTIFLAQTTIDCTLYSKPSIGNETFRVVPMAVWTPSLPFHIAAVLRDVTNQGCKDALCWQSERKAM